MASAIFRLPLRKYPQFFFGAQNVESRGYSVFLRPNDSNNTRLCVIVPKRTMGKAVQRNWLKRRVRSSLSPSLPADTGWDIVVRVKKKNNSLQDFYAVRSKITSIIHTAH